jgi:hypothetical protein
MVFSGLGVGLKIFLKLAIDFNPHFLIFLAQTAANMVAFPIIETALAMISLFEVIFESFICEIGFKMTNV